MEPVKTTFQDILEAKRTIAPLVQKSPLVPFYPTWDSPSENDQLYLKLENLSPTGCFKHRSAITAIDLLSPEQRKKGVYTVSSGNFAKSLAWVCRKYGIKCEILLSDNAAEAKVQGIVELGGHVTKLPYDAWWRVYLDYGYEGMESTFVHPTCNVSIIAGFGTIGLEILEDLPDVDTILVPFGTGSSSCGIAMAAKHLKPELKVYAVEVCTNACYTAALRAGKPVSVDYKPSLADGMSGTSVHPDIWPLASKILDGSIVVTPAQVAEAIKLLAERGHVVVEGAGAAPVAAAMTGKAGPGKVVCVVTGGNIDTDKLIAVLQGRVPE